jgi:hypothetical protein
VYAENRVIDSSSTTATTTLRSQLHDDCTLKETIASALVLAGGDVTVKISLNGGSDKYF